jgi:HD-GYP domain-containing protein (c-di-GMP phosphodiesterase class II)
MAEVKELPSIPRDRNIACANPQEFSPLPLRLLKNGQKLPVNIYLKDHEQSGAHFGFVLRWPRGEAFRPGKEALWGYFSLAEVAPLLSHLLARIEEEALSRETSDLEKAAFFYDVTLVWTQSFFLAEPAAQTLEQLQAGGSLVGGLFILMQGELRPQDLVVSLRRHDSGLFSHCLNVCLLGLTFIEYLGWSEKEARVFGLGSLLHDIGMAPLSQVAWGKTEPLTEEEQEAIKAHPLKGRQLLAELGGVPEEILMMVAQHHESDDGSGYPLGLKEAAIHPWARLLKIIDSFEALTSIRPWRAPLSPEKALHVLQHSVPQTSSQSKTLRQFMEL